MMLKDMKIGMKVKINFTARQVMEGADEVYVGGTGHIVEISGSTVYLGNEEGLTNLYSYPFAYWQLDPCEVIQEVEADEDPFGFTKRPYSAPGETVQRSASGEVLEAEKPKSAYKIFPTQWTRFKDNIFEDLATIVEIDDEAGGPFVVIKQCSDYPESAKVSFDANEVEDLKSMLDEAVRVIGLMNE